jgi:hypothetical protein
MGQEMRYNMSMTTRTEIDAQNLATVNSAQLILALEDLGFDEVDIIQVDSGFALTIDGIIIAIGIGDDPLDASENLLDRAADLFYYSIPKA